MRVFAIIRLALINNLNVADRLKLENNFFDLSTPAAVYWQKFSGKSIQIVLKNIQALFTNLPHDGIIVVMKQIVEHLAIISHLSGVKTLTNEEMGLIQQAIAAIKDLTKKDVCKEISVTPYLHMLLEHFMPQIERLGSVSFFSDQCSENIHGYMDKDKDRIVGLSHRDELVFFALQHTFRQKLFDERQETN
uniref:Uncharacterized protein n=1 Tax=Rhabditophanes sp. KR3021 TaxID=114890 RepID=A0AC35TUI8_9BILA